MVGINKFYMWVLRVVGILFAVTLLLGTASCMTVDAVTGERVYNLYSLDDDVQLGQAAISANLEELRKSGVRVNADSVRLGQLETIVRRIAAVSDLPQLPYRVTLVHTGIVNACAFPGGQVMVFEGLYDPTNGLVRTEDELAAVIAHEIAHVTCRHATERLSKIMTAAAAAEVAASLAERRDHEKTALAIRSLFMVGSSLWIPVYSRQDEYEADRIGIFYMAKAGYDPRAAVEIWRRVAEREPKERNVLASIFATHPGSRERYEALQKVLPEAMELYARTHGHYPQGYVPTGRDLSASL